MNHPLTSPVSYERWPYPRWIAHRGAGTLAPENTLAAIRLGARHGFRMFECDAQLSADGVPFLLHDTTLERTTDGRGNAGELDWARLSRLDAGRWHSPAFAGEPLPGLEAVARLCREQGLAVNLEIKPAPGRAAETGRVVAQMADRWWSAPGGEDAGSMPPLLTSFEPEALEAARAAAPALPRGLLLERLWPGWQDTAARLECVTLVCQHELWTPALLRLAHGRRWRALAYTVNDEASAQRLLQWGIDGLITDRVDLFRPEPG